ncbi:MAG: hypothetical protein KatS3mg129_2903 [Leptospiraceae bacterium]|nr:MAG: hypothetical protein KatS3mg129_2903 [Leptospiraceae bacterium]
MKNQIYKIIIGILILFLMASCGKKKNPLLFLLGGISNTSQTTPAKGDIPLSYVNGQEEQQNNNSEQTDPGTSDNSQNNTSNTENEELIGTVIVEDQTSEQEFNFNTTITVGFSISVVDLSGPVSGAIVNITDPSMGNIIIFQGITNENGIVTGNITIPTALENVDINVKIGEHTAVQTVPIQKEDEFVIFINRQIVFNQEVEDYINQIQDTDGDGISDELDSYPDDPTRATRTILPNSGISIIAYEDLFPDKGDADFNDIVMQVINEEDLNAQGQVVRIRGKYKLLAKGAGYAHVVFLNLPGKGTFNAKVYDENNQLQSDVSIHLDTLNQLPIFIKNDGFFKDRKINNSSIYFTNQLCSGMCNVYANRPISNSYSAEIEIIFDEPIEKAQLLAAPYDLYVYVNNTKKEIHFPGLYKDSNGKDLYIDSQGFPWAIQIPIEWNWPLERNDIRNAYPYFEEWYKSNGKEYKDWYKRFDEKAKSHQFQYFNISPLSAYFLQFGNVHQSLLWTFLAIFTSGILVFLFIKGRTKYEV